MVATNTQLTTSGSPTYIRMECAIVGVYTADQTGREVVAWHCLPTTSPPSII
jgi:hypothetical protein